MYSWLVIKNIKKPLTVSFGILFSFIGFANTFWGNDPYYGLAILLISVLFYMPLIDSFRNNLSSKAKTLILFFLGFFVLWSSAGVGELSDKIKIMIENFPYTKITGY